MESNDYQTHLNGRSERSAREALLTLKKHFSHLFDKPIQDITPQDVIRWRASMRKKGRAESTIQRAGTELVLLVNRAIGDKWLDHNPLADLKPLKQSTLQTEAKLRHLSSEEHKQLRTALRARDADKKRKAMSGQAWREKRGYAVREDAEVYATAEFFDYLEPMVLLSLNTGIRKGELFSLEWQDIDLDTKTMTLRACNTKASKGRTIPLNAEALEALQHWRNQTDSNQHVFSNNGKPFTTVKKAWAAVLHDSGIKNFRWHDMRHTFASDLVIAGIPLNTVRDLMGHSDIKMTLRYAHLSDNSRADAVAMLGAVR